MYAFPWLVFPYGDKKLFTTLFLLVNHTVKVTVYNSLSLKYGSPMFCKSGILIFIFAENNYLVRQYICSHHVN